MILQIIITQGLNVRDQNNDSQKVYFVVWLNFTEIKGRDDYLPGFIIALLFMYCLSVCQVKKRIFDEQYFFGIAISYRMARIA